MWLLTPLRLSKAGIYYRNNTIFFNMEKTGYFEASPGNKSSSRLIAFIVIIWALVLATAVVWFGKETIIVAAAAAGTIVTTIASPAYLFMFNQKRQEIKQ